MGDRDSVVLYWDASAVLSALFQDTHSEDAVGWSRAGGAHLLSSLGYSETCAVIARLEREQLVPGVQAQSARDALAGGPWRRLTLSPDWGTIDELAPAWPLRGADLWHLATAATLRREVPSLAFLTYDARLAVAAGGIGLSR